MANSTDGLYDARNGIHTGLTAIMAWIALWLTIPDNTFSGTAIYAYMSRIAPEPVWAMAFWAVANIGLIGLAAGRSVLQLVSVLVLATAHGVLAGCFLMSGASFGSGTYAIIAGMGYYLAYRRARAGI